MVNAVVLALKHALSKLHEMFQIILYVLYVHSQTIAALQHFCSAGEITAMRKENSVLHVIDDWSKEVNGIFFMRTNE